MAKLLIFAGTTEGRRLIEALLAAEPAVPEGKKPEIFACVATEYGRDVLEESAAKQERDGLKILSGRLTEEEMAELMSCHSFAAVVDATHPYAAVVTACIRGACAAASTPYIRLLRESGGNGHGEKAGGGRNAVFVSDTQGAVRFLSGTEGSALLTTGSKELHAFTELEGYQKRLYARVLPMEEVVQKCAALGFQGRQLICMQGPFSYEMNAAMLRQTGAKYLVTKDSGKTGGFDEKLRAAEDLGVCPVIIGRKPEEGGLTLQQTAEQLAELCGMRLCEGLDVSTEIQNMENSGGKSDWFPLFTNIKDCHITVVGAGKIAARRIRTLLQFSCKVTVIAPEAGDSVKEAADSGRLKLVSKAYETSDLFDIEEGSAADYVLAATNDRSCNHRIYCDCKLRGIPVNVADCKEESDFYFPGLARRGAIVAAFTAGGTNHGLVKEVSKRVRQILADLEDGI